MDVASAARDVYIGCHGDLTGWGGAMIAGRGLASACERAGLWAMLLGVGERQPEAPATVEGTPQQNVPVSPWPMLWRAHNLCVPHMLAGQLRRLPRPRLAFVSLCPFWTVAARRAWPDLPVLLRFQGLLSNCLPFTRRVDHRLGFWPRVGAWAAGVVERHALRAADLILVPTPEHAQEIADFEPSRRGRVEVCPEDCRRYEITPALRHEQRRRLRLAATDFLVAAIGSCDPNKAFDHAIRELARTDPRSKLLIVGDGSERDGLQRLARDLGVADRIQLVGWRSDMAGVYAAADCVISTSFYDTFPNVIREALACGRPVIVPRHAPPRVYAGISGLLHREGAGLSYDRLRPGALAEQLNRLIGDPRAANEFGRSGYRAAQRLFGWQPTVQRIRLAAGLEADDQSSHAYDPAEPPTAAAEEPGAGAAEVAHTFVR